jgi:tripartite-type tricarboxylate transporter receptor subunit TctC
MLRGRFPLSGTVILEGVRRITTVRLALWSGQAETGVNVMSRVQSCLRGAALLSMLAVQALPALAADAYPSRPMRMIVAFSAGGSLDLTARIIAQKFTESGGHPMVVDNRVGAGGITGSDIVAKATPDGYTLLMASASNAVHPALFPNGPHNFVRDFAPVSIVSSNAYAVAVHPSLPVANIRDLIALAKSRPKALSFGSSGNGGLPHLSTELLKSMAGVDLLHVPYKGGAQALIDLMGGRIDLMVNSIPLLLPQTKTGKIRMLAVTTLKRADSVPDVPTVAESGVPGYDVNGWYGLVVPAKTSPAIIKKLHHDITRFVKMQDVRDRIHGDGGNVFGSTPQEFAAVIRADVDKWTALVAKAGVKAE